MNQGVRIFEVLFDGTGTPVDIEVNHRFEQMTGLRAPVGKQALDLVPNLERHWIEAYGRVALTGEARHFVQGSEAMGRWFDVHAARIGEPEQRLVALVFSDITEHRRAQEERARRGGPARQRAPLQGFRGYRARHVVGRRSWW